MNSAGVTPAPASSRRFGVGGAGFQPPLRSLGAGACMLLGSAAAALASLTSSQEIPKLRPPRAELPPTVWEEYGMMMVVAGTLTALLFAAVVWFLTRPKPVAGVLPEAEARRALEPLRRQPESGPVLSQVSRVVRQYLGAVFGLPPGELTTGEFCRALEHQERVGPELSASAKQFLRLCDERKFAPTPPQPPLGAADQALQLIGAAEQRLARVQAAAATPPPVMPKEAA